MQERKSVWNSSERIIIHARGKVERNKEQKDTKERQERLFWMTRNKKEKNQ